MKIAVVGSINMDMTALADKIPKKGETIAGTDLVYVPGGKGANQAVAAAKLGADTVMYGCVGNDAAGKTLCQNLERCGVDASAIQVVENVPTGVAIITVAEGDNTIVVVPGANGCVSPQYVDSIRDGLCTADMVLLQHEIPQESINRVIDLCSENGVPVLLNPAPARPVSADMVEKLSYLTPNEHEAAVLFGDKELNELLMAYPNKLVVTLGAEGAAACTNGSILRVPARKCKVVDTTGAGDTLNAAFAVRIAAGDSLEDALTYANTAAALSIQKRGAQGGMPTAAEVESALKQGE